MNFHLDLNGSQNSGVPKHVEVDSLEDLFLSPRDIEFN